VFTADDLLDPAEEFGALLADLAHTCVALPAHR
jgi:hypothetical protein